MVRTATHSKQGVGNVAVKVRTNGYTPGVNNQYTAITGANAESALSYDNDGNMIASGTWSSYAYDHEDRLVSMSNASTTINYIYDYMGRRIRKTVTGVGAADTKFLWQGWTLVADLNAADGATPLRGYIWGPDFSDAHGAAGGAGSLLAQTTLAGISYALPDLHGNIAGYLNASGTLVAAWEYSPYGKIIKSYGAVSSYPIGFSGKYTDAETGLVYYGLRYYNPKHGRFVNRDPSEEQGGLNLYAFVGNSPMNAWDVLGLMTCHLEYVEEGLPDQKPGETNRDRKKSWQWVCVLDAMTISSGEKDYQPPPTQDANKTKSGPPRVVSPGGGTGLGSDGTDPNTGASNKTGKARLEALRDQILEKLCGDSDGEAAVDRLGKANVNMAFSKAGLGGITTFTNGAFNVTLFVGPSDDPFGLAESAYHESVHATQESYYRQFASLPKYARGAMTSYYKRQMEFQAYSQSANYALRTWRRTSHGSFVTEASYGAPMIDPGKVLAFVNTDAMPETAGSDASVAKENLTRENPQLLSIGGWDCEAYKQRKAAQE